MKTYTFQANCKNEKRAIEIAKEFLRDLRECPESFELKVNKLRFNTYKITAINL